MENEEIRTENSKKSAKKIIVIITAVIIAVVGISFTIIKLRQNHNVKDMNGTYRCVGTSYLGGIDFNTGGVNFRANRDEIEDFYRGTKIKIENGRINNFIGFNKSRFNIEIYKTEDGKVYFDTAEAIKANYHKGKKPNGDDSSIDSGYAGIVRGIYYINGAEDDSYDYDIRLMVKLEDTDSVTDFILDYIKE